jgi:TonB family protein
MNLSRFTAFIFTSILFLLLVCLSVSFAQSNRDSQTNGPNSEYVYPGKETDQKAIVIKRVEPHYTKKARKHRVEGTVILRCVFSSIAKVTNITVASGLPDGLTEEAIEAARRIKFKPAMRNGKPVSMWMQLEYNFNLR